VAQFLQYECDTDEIRIDTEQETWVQSMRARIQPKGRMTLKIDRIPDGTRVTIQLIGRMSSEHIAELAALIENSRTEVVLDLDEVTLADVDAVNFLRKCQTEGIELRNCPPYIREWIHREDD
jgi:hypothetical protein